MLDKEKKEELLQNNYYINKRKDARTRNRFVTTKHRLFLLGVFSALCIILFLYFRSEQSHVFAVTVDGNIYLKEKDIIDASGISTNDRYLLLNPAKAEKLLQEHPLIQSAEVRKKNDRIIAVTVKEKKALGYYSDEGKTMLWLDDDSSIELDLDSIYLIYQVPLIEGFTAEQRSELLHGFRDLDADAINEISEIHRYPFTYDENNLEIIMRDGNYIFAGSYGLKYLSRYYTIVSGLGTDSELCLYFDEVTESGYTSACPWEESTSAEPVSEEPVDEDF
ncbi:MAG: FtsQ-type POTRA domain-containing protein [Erysipelotrichaceae bacterium]|nr:FtsQ-type POTRA domain-containing protein [Erysipelotrichaceae bacterium]